VITGFLRCLLFGILPPPISFLISTTTRCCYIVVLFSFLVVVLMITVLFCRPACIVVVHSLMPISVLFCSFPIPDACSTPPTICYSTLFLHSTVRSFVLPAIHLPPFLRYVHHLRTMNSGCSTTTVPITTVVRCSPLPFTVTTTCYRLFTLYHHLRSPLFCSVTLPLFVDLRLRSFTCSLPFHYLRLLFYVCSTVTVSGFLPFLPPPPAFVVRCSPAVRSAGCSTFRSCTYLRSAVTVTFTCFVRYHRSALPAVVLPPFTASTVLVCCRSPDSGFWNYRWVVAAVHYRLHRSPPPAVGTCVTILFVYVLFSFVVHRSFTVDRFDTLISFVYRCCSTTFYRYYVTYFYICSLRYVLR